MAKTATAASYDAGTLHQVTPGSLLLERNIRDAQPDEGLIASIAAVGVLEPITAVVTDNGLMVRTGHRRTLAAIEAGLDTVPVYVTGTDSLDNHAEVERIIAQRDENTHRAGLTAGEEADVVGQLALLGLSADQIAEQARIARDRVDVGLRLSKSPLMSQAAKKYADLTMEQAVAIAEFDDDLDVQKGLIIVAIERPSYFPHELRRKREERELRVLEEEGKRLAEATGLTVIDTPEYDDKRVFPLERLAVIDDDGVRQPLTPDAHADCPGHAVYPGSKFASVDPDTGEDLTDAIAAYEDALDALQENLSEEDVERFESDDEAWEAYVVEKLGAAPGARAERRRIATVAYACTDAIAHGHTGIYSDLTDGGKKPADAMTDEEREKAKAERRLVIDNNKAWDLATEVRREWLATFAQRKTAPKGTGAFLAAAVALDLQDVLDYQPNTLAEEWLGIENTRTSGKSAVTKAAAEATEQRALQIALVQVLGRVEAKLGKNAWRENGTASRAGRYLRFLQAAGYGLSEVEEFAVSKKTV